MNPSLWIGTDPAGRRVSVPLDELVHAVSFGASGLGKSRHMQHLVRQCWNLSLLGQRCSTIVIDPHGDLFDDLVADAYAMGIGDRLVVFDPGPIWSPTLNPLSAEHDVDVASLVLRAVQKACGDRNPDQMPRLQRHLRATLRVLEASGATLLEAFDFLTDPNTRSLLLENVEDRYVRSTWDRFEELTPRLQEERIESTENRVDRLVVGSPLMRRVLGAAQSSIDIGQVMDQGKHLLVNLGHAHMTHEQRKLLGSLLVETIFETAVRRPRGRRSPCVVFVDEAADFLCGDEDLPRALAQTRKFGVHFVLAFQMLAQLTEEHPLLKSAVLTNTNLRFAFGGSREDAEAIAGELFTGQFHGDEVKHELHATRFRPVESTRTIVSDATSHGESLASSHMTGAGSMGGSGIGTSQTYDALQALDQVSAAQSSFAGSSDFSASGSSSTTSSARTHGEAVAPFMEQHEFRELSGVQFRTPEEQRERHTALVKRQPPRCFYFQHGHHRDAVPLFTPDVYPFPVAPAARDRFLRRVFRRTGCMVQAEAIDAQIAARFDTLRPKLQISVSTEGGKRDGRERSPKSGKLAPSPTQKLLAAKRGERNGGRQSCTPPS